MLYREIIAVCSEIHTKHINTLCGQNVEIFSIKPGGAYSDRRASAAEMNCIGNEVKAAHSDGGPSSLKVALRYCSRRLSERNRTPQSIINFLSLLLQVTPPELQDRVVKIQRGRVATVIWGGGWYFIWLIVCTILCKGLCTLARILQI
jgi:hypothetical protein